MSRTLDARTVIKPAKFAHYVLRVSDLEKSIAWYQAVLGMEIVHHAGRIAFLTYDDEHHRLALAQVPPGNEAKRGAPGLDHVAYTLNSLGELLGTYKRLAAQGIEPVWPINHGLTTSLYYEDPDGCRVEFQVENFRTAPKNYVTQYAMVERLARVAEQLGLADVSPYKQQIEWVRSQTLMQAKINSYTDAINIDTRAQQDYYNNNIGRYTEALPPLARATELNPRSPVFQNNLGQALERLGYYTEARTAYESAVASDSGYVKASTGLARVTGIEQESR